MPVIAISRRQLSTCLGQECSLEELADYLEQLGCDVDEVGDSSSYRCSRCSMLQERLSREEPPTRCEDCGFEGEVPFELVGSEETIKLDLLPARPDLFDVGGLSRALRGYLGISRGLPEYPVEAGSVEVEIDASVADATSFRPHIACAVVECAPLDAAALKDLMKFQESLHWGIGRNRKLASIGVYDLEGLQLPIRYTTVGPAELRFCPLGHPDQPMTPEEILEQHAKGKVYAHLLSDHARYPLLIDAAGQVLSMPPIINSEETRVREGNTRLFVDVTGITADDVARTLHTLVSSLAELGAQLRSVTMRRADGSHELTPQLQPGSAEIEVSEANRWLGLDLDTEAAGALLEKMRLSYEDSGAGRLRVHYPAYRGDVKHQVDIFEDMAIGYGYRNLIPDLVEAQTLGQARPEEVLKDRAREVLLGLGCHEILSLLLTTSSHHFSRLRCEPQGQEVEVANPKIQELRYLRGHLLSGLLETLEKNKGRPAPQRYFEIGPSFHLYPEGETGTREEVRVAFALLGSGGFADARGVMDALLWELGLDVEYQADEHVTFIPGRLACIRQNGEVVGRVGEIHPEVLNNFNIRHSVGVGELRLARLFG